MGLMNAHHRANLLDIYQTALRAVNGRLLVGHFLRQRSVLSNNVVVIAIGKAATAMAEGAYDTCGQRVVACLVITKRGYGDTVFSPSCTIIESDHPLPSAQSLYAGDALLDFIHQAPADAQFLVLISGGASSLVEVLPQGIDLSDLLQLNKWLLSSGLDISYMNALRRRMSCIKGGRLALHLAGRSTYQLLISDVPGDVVADIGSGLLIPSLSVALPCEGIIPVALEGKLNLAPPLPNEQCFTSISSFIVGQSRLACAAAAQRAAELGYRVFDESEFIQGDAELAGKTLAAALLRGPEGVYIWGGETTVNLPPTPGRGGRNQHAALAAACVLAGTHTAALLIAATDGSDGPGEDAGALVDGGTLQRGRVTGFDPVQCLQQANSGTFLQASGDLIRTGPTGTNVMDIMLGLRI